MARLYNDRFNEDDPRLVAPAAVTTEGDRIRAALAAGTYGNQPVAAAATALPAGGVTPTASDTDPTGRFGNSFFNQPSMWQQNLNPARLRQDLRLDELTTLAAQRKFDLERSRVEAPLRDRLLEAQTAAAGAHDRFLREQDVQTMQHTAGFLNDMVNGPAPQDPGYSEHVLRAAAKYPRFAETSGGKDFLTKIGKTHDTHLSMEDIRKQYGSNVSSVTVGPNGQSVTLKPPDEPDVALEADAKKLGLSLGQIRNPVKAEVGKFVKDPKTGVTKFEGDEAGDVVQVRNTEGQPVVMSAKEYERLGGTFSAEGAAKRGMAPAIDLTAMARAALNDPEATEAERAQARKRLGL